MAAVTLEPAKLNKMSVGISYQACSIERVGNAISIICHDARNAKVFDIKDSWRAMDFVEDYLTDAAKKAGLDRLELRNWLREAFGKMGLR